MRGNAESGWHERCRADPLFNIALFLADSGLTSEAPQYARP
jgi:hypothetical protein